MISPDNTISTIAERRYRLAFGLLCAMLFVMMMLLVPHYGSSGDELTRYQYGKAVVDYYFGLDVGNHMHDVNIRDTVHPYFFQPYGALFDGTATLLIHAVNPKDDYLFRHYMNAIVGFIGLLLAGLIGKRISGKWSGALLTLILFLATPRYWGECFNNPKDIPFATTALFFLYTLLGWLQNVHALTWTRTLLMAIALMLPLCIRPGGLLFIAYFMLIAGIYFLGNKNLRNLKYCFQILVFFLIAYFGCVFFWPQAWMNPLLAPIVAFKAQSKYLVGVHVLFEGLYTDCKFLPWYYTHKLLLITLPLIVILGFLMSTVLVFVKKTNWNRRSMMLVISFALFPLLSMIVRGTVLYDGVRQILFIVAFIIIAAAMGVWQLLVLLKTKKIAFSIVGLLLIIGLSLPLKYSIANHPNEYIYYNELVGGVHGAYGHYELDYYFNSAKQAYDWLDKNEGTNIRASNDSLVLASDCYKHFIYNYNHVGQLPLKIEDGNLFLQHKTDWDYAIFFTRYLDKEALLNGYFNSPKAIHKIMVDGVPVCMVLKNDKDRFGYKGELDIRAGRVAEAEANWLAAVKQYPNDVELWTSLTLLYIQQKNYPMGQWAVDNALRISSINHNTVHLAWEIAFLKNDIPKALKILQFATSYYKGTDAPWLRLAEAQAMNNDVVNAEQNLEKGLALDTNDHYRIYTVKSIIAEKKGNAGEALYWRSLAGKYQPY